MRYAALFIGVNVTPGATPLNYAELDAARMARLLCSNLAYGRTSNTATLLGPSATRASVKAAVAKMQREAPDCALVYFSGHGSPEGIALADGLLTYDELAELLLGIGSVRPIVIVDACHAGAGFHPFLVRIGGVGGLQDDMESEWISVVQDSVRGLRFFAAVASGHGTYEEHAIGGGRFSWSLRRGLRRAPGRFFGKYAWVTELDAFNYAAEEMARRWPHDELPLFLAPRASGNPMPLVLAQAARVVGMSKVALVRPRATAGIAVLLRARGRQFIPTFVRVRVYDATGLLVGEALRTWHPTEELARHRENFSVGWPTLQASNDVLAATVFDRPFGLNWEVTLLDDFGRVLDSTTWQCLHVAA
jgi:hypothetical protein